MWIILREDDMTTQKHVLHNIISRSAKILKEEMQQGINMLNWNTLQAGDLVDVDAEFNSYPRTRITQKLDDVSRESGLPPGPGFIGTDERGDEYVFSIQDVVPASYEKYAMAESQRVASALKRLIKEYDRTS
jgi:hypothetical protein